MDQRLAEIAERLTNNVKEVIQEYEITEAEWFQVLEFFTKVGKKDEFILLSDVLGLSVFINDFTHSHEHHDHATDFSVEGPLYRENAPLVDTPAQLCSIEDSNEPLIMSGQVLTVDGEPITNAIVDVWQANENGDYENEDPNQEEFNLRRRIKVDVEGRYQFTSILPAPYEIGKGGPVGEFLKRIDRHAWRPAHIHFKIEAEGYDDLTTMLFLPNDPWIDNDSISAVKDSLILDMKKIDHPEVMQKHDIDKPFYTCNYDFRLVPVNQGESEENLQTKKQTVGSSNSL